ncbi:MAG: Tim44 domain-containing protein [Desulfobacterales bacterium]|nr:Tim44 domain-containing protein [Desulfobacterales bacterium]
MSISRKLTPVLILLIALMFTASTFDTADARSKKGGRKFKSPTKQTQQTTQGTSQVQQKRKSGGFMRGLAGGLLGGAIGAFLFGSLMGGEGMGILPILLFAGIGFFLFRRFTRAKQNPGAGPGGFGGAGPAPGFGAPGPKTLDQGLNEIRSTDPMFDPKAFLETASDCFFQVQAGWMRRDLSSYRNLLGDQLAAEYAEEFARMEEKGIINKLESIAIRTVDMTDAGSTGSEDFVTVLFKANLLDYTVDEHTGEVVEGSDTQPVKFEEEWTFARPVGTHNWRLEGIDVVKG